MKTDKRRTKNEGCLDTRAAIKTKIKGQIKSGPHTQVNSLGKAYFKRSTDAQAQGAHKMAEWRGVAFEST